MRYIPESGVRILEGLATFKFLTNQQFYDLGVCKSLSHVWVARRKLEEDFPGIIGKLDFPAQPRIGRLPGFYFLTRKGADFVSDTFHMDFDKIKYPVGAVTFGLNDYAHRIATVDVFIAFRKWAKERDFSVILSDGYFDKIGANRTTERLRAKTKIDFGKDYIIPDGVCFFESGARRFLFLFEVYNGHDTKRVLEQARKHAIALSEGSPSLKYGHDRSAFVGFIFETPGAKKSAMSRMNSDGFFRNVHRFFLFKTLDECKADFHNRWELFDGSTVDFIERN